MTIIHSPQMTTLQPELQTIQMMKGRKSTSRWYLWMMNIGFLRRYLKEHYAFTYQIPSYMDSLDLSDVLGFEDYMVTSRDEDIPAFEDTSD